MSSIVLQILSQMCTLYVLVALLPYVVTSQDTCPVARYTGSFNASDHVKDHALLGTSYKNLTISNVQQCFSSCVNDCRCVSYQLYGTRCEVSDEDRHTALDVYKPVSGYKYYELQQRFKESVSNVCSSQCNNGCCRYAQPCLNGGTCIELCKNVTRKFACKCREGFAGRVCEIPTSCTAYSTSSASATFPIQIFNGNRLQVYCDMTSEPGIVWTLIESFVFSKKRKYEDKSFFKDFPVNEESHSWSDYRLSRSTIEHIKRHATHWRATCNYNDTEGLNKTDYIRGLLSDRDVFVMNGLSECVKVQYINVRGISCENCTTHFIQSTQKHAFVDSRYGSYGVAVKCQWDGRKGAVGIGWNGCDNFGYYSTVNPEHRCSSAPFSTTQWWLGTAV